MTNAREDRYIIRLVLQNRRALSRNISLAMGMFAARPVSARMAVILDPDEGGVECAGGTDADTAIGNAGAQMLGKLLESERLLELDHVTALESLSLLLTISESLFEEKYAPPTKVTRDV
ncbi:hypothetical protein TNCV_1971021 [Trichonephila clavipes]|uniref:Uncharacterized protein n=1 Tax=Trichonephila clavipes TaxID=2585209 RepID=A0A8X6W517_TRICX|nr:hypothetical protein TNCV_1971021 [Trichonephila clavipes]